MRCPSSSFSLTLLLLFLVSSASAHQAYQTEIPNGDKVYYDGSFWPGVGHSIRAGGMNSRLNAFGDAFIVAKRIWTVALCEADSDGDGQTNGFELGDPDCGWSKEAGDAALNRTTNISHPGIALSMTTAVLLGGAPVPLADLTAPPNGTTPSEYLGPDGSDLGSATAPPAPRVRYDGSGFGPDGGAQGAGRGRGGGSSGSESEGMYPAMRGMYPGVSPAETVGPRVAPIPRGPAPTSPGQGGRHRGTMLRFFVRMSFKSDIDTMFAERSQVITLVAAALQITNTSQVTVVSIRAGSTIIKFQVEVEEGVSLYQSATEIEAALNQSTADGDFDAYSVTSVSVTSSADEVTTGPTTPTPDSMFAADREPDSSPDKNLVIAVIVILVIIVLALAACGIAYFCMRRNKKKNSVGQDPRCPLTPTTSVNSGRTSLPPGLQPGHLSRGNTGASNGLDDGDDYEMGDGDRGFIGGSPNKARCAGGDSSSAHQLQNMPSPRQDMDHRTQGALETDDIDIVAKEVE